MDSSFFVLKHQVVASFKVDNQKAFRPFTITSSFAPSMDFITSFKLKQPSFLIGFKAQLVIKTGYDVYECEQYAPTHRCV